MTAMITQQNITFALAMLTAIFVVYNYFRNPQIISERSEFGFGIQLRNLEKELTNLKDNHLHTIDQKLDANVAEMTSIKVEIGKLATIIDERIPKKI